MTKRQKQSYLVKNNIIEVTEQSVNKKIGRIGLEDETVLFSLDPSRTTNPMRTEMPRRIKRHNVVTEEEKAEKQTEELQKILEEINQNQKDTETNHKSLKEQRDKDGVGHKRWLFQLRTSTNTDIGKNSIFWPKQDDSFPYEGYVKTISSTLAVTEDEQGTSTYKSLTCYPKSFQIPYLLNQSVTPLVSKIEEKSKSDKCDNCSLAFRKYLCKATGKISCSFECYTQNKQNHMAADAH